MKLSNGFVALLLALSGCGGGGGDGDATPVDVNKGVVLSDSFDAENGGNVQTSVESLTNWIITPDIDLVGSGPLGESFNDYPGQGLFLDLDGSDFKNGAIESKESFPAGDYILSFKLGNNPRAGGTINTLTASLDSFSQESPTSGTLSLDVKQFAFTTQKAGKLRFVQGGPADNQGSILDDVRLEKK